MPVYVFWGDDDFAMVQAVEALRQGAIDPDWGSFNVDKLPSEQPDAVMQALNQVMTPPFGAGKRFVWLVDTPLLQRCPEDVLAELERTLPAIPEASVLLLTSPTKPDGRLKSTKLLQKYAEVREFSQISPWKTDLLVKQVRQAAQTIGVRLTPEAVDLLVESVGNNTRQLYTELEKLRLYADGSKPLDATIVATLVTATNQNALQLGTAVRQGQVAEALDLVADLLRQNEPALRIVNSLVTQFRTWIWVKVMTESGERNEQVIAQAAELKNPKRLYYLQQEVRTLSLPTLLGTLPILLDLEASLKRGADDLSILQTKVIELCELCR